MAVLLDSLRNVLVRFLRVQLVSAKCSSQYDELSKVKANPIRRVLLSTQLVPVGELNRVPRL